MNGSRGEQQRWRGGSVTEARTRTREREREGGRLPGCEHEVASAFVRCSWRGCSTAAGAGGGTRDGERCFCVDNIDEGYDEESERASEQANNVAVVDQRIINHNETATRAWRGERTTINNNDNDDDDDEENDDGEGKVRECRRGKDIAMKRKEEEEEEEGVDDKVAALRGGTTIVVGVTQDMNGGGRAEQNTGRNGENERTRPRDV